MYKRFQNRRKSAVTPVIGTIIIITIILSATATVLLWGLPYIERTRAEAQQQNLYAQMNIFEDTLNSLIHQGPGATEENIFQISMGTFGIKSEETRFVVFYSLDNNHDFILSGLNQQQNNYFDIEMIKGTCDKIKIYRLGTRTAYSRFNPETYFEELPSQDIKEYVNLATIHNFTDTTNNSAFHSEGSTETDIPSPDETYNSYSPPQYDNISSVGSGENEWLVSSGRWKYLHYKFLLNEPILNINYINVSWRGFISDDNTVTPSSHLSLFVWNDSSDGKWDLMGTMDESTAVNWLNVSISSDISNYIYLENDKHYISIAISGGNQNYGCRIIEDYIHINVSYTEHDTKPPASYIDESLKSVRTYFDPDSITFT